MRWQSLGEEMNVSVAVDLYNLAVQTSGVCNTFRLVSSDADHVPVVIERNEKDVMTNRNGFQACELPEFHWQEVTKTSAARKEHSC